MNQKKTKAAPAIAFSRVVRLHHVVAIGSSVGIPLSLIVFSDDILRVAGTEAPMALIIAGLLFLPLLFSMGHYAAANFAAGLNARFDKEIRSDFVTFLIDWLLLGGWLLIISLMAEALSESAGNIVRTLTGGTNRPNLLVLILLLVAMRQVLTHGNKTRLMSIVIWACFGGLMVFLIWSFLKEPSQEVLRWKFNYFKNWLTPVTMVASAICVIDLIGETISEMRQPRRDMVLGPLITWGLIIFVGYMAMGLLLRRPEFIDENLIRHLSWEQDLAEILLLALALTMVWIGLNASFSRALRLMSHMSSVGTLPSQLRIDKAEERAITGPVIVLSVIVFALIVVICGDDRIGVAAIFFLWVGVLFLWPALFSSRERAKKTGIPGHPYVVGLSVSIGIFMSFFSLGSSLILFALWLVLGLSYYSLYGRRSRLASQSRRMEVGRSDEIVKKEKYRILVCVHNDQDAPSLIRAAAAIAVKQQGELLVLRPLLLVDQVSIMQQRNSAEEALVELRRWIDGNAADGLTVQSMVRIAATESDAILRAAVRYEVDFILIGEMGDKQEAAMPLQAEISRRVFESTSKPLGVLTKNLPTPVQNVLVCTSGGPHTALALRLGTALAEKKDGAVVLAMFVGRAKGKDEPQAILEKIIVDPNDIPTVRKELFPVHEVRRGIVQKASQFDILLMGASSDQVLHRTVYGGVAKEVADARDGATIVVKEAEAARIFWWRRMWEFLMQPIPAMSLEERTDVFREMRQSATAGLDFYVLIFLAAAIATFGLLLNSTAVIIGAMLVAPLMSPILALGYGIVIGHLGIIERGTLSTLKGIGLAIAVSAMFTGLLPGDDLTSEILARTRPNAFDLLVALAAGAAAAYGVCRKSVAAALPGVAISVALVPPLCVVGYGLATSRLAISSGALLLFVTNLAGIVLVGALVFILFGFRPALAERGRRVRRAIMLAITGIILLSIPLGLGTRDTILRRRVEDRIMTVLQESVEPRGWVLHEGRVRRRQGRFLVTATIFCPSNPTPEEIGEIRQLVNKITGSAIHLDLTFVLAHFLDEELAADRDGEQ